MENDNPTWQELPLGGVITEAGNAVHYDTGGWRAFRPVIALQTDENTKGCVHCLQCWLFCPEAAVIVVDDKVTGIDLDHCKGCGLCAQVCRRNCITMITESQFQVETKA